MSAKDPALVFVGHLSTRERVEAELRETVDAVRGHLGQMRDAMAEAKPGSITAGRVHLEAAEAVLDSLNFGPREDEGGEGAVPADPSGDAGVQEGAKGSRVGGPSTCPACREREEEDRGRDIGRMLLPHSSTGEGS